MARYYIEPPQETTGIVKVFDYMIGFVAFGLTYYIFSGPVNIFYNASSTVSNAEWPLFLWWGSLVVYLVFGAFWFLNSLREKGGT